mmetsp:Transcript_8839/g.16064  ORF Transcript_8839/g.16064 Transcript_8839/m.16064 type:complete len:373 (-) Transcript_8839:412-1530(-)
MMLRILIGMSVLAVGTLPLGVAEEKIMPDHTVKNAYSLPLPKSYIAFQDLPDAFSWANVDGKSHVTHMLNQHIPQYCGSCWAHSSMSSLADRIQIARSVGVGPQQGPPGPEINLSIQFLLNCGAQVAGSCSGGSATGAYEFIHSHSKFIPYDTCQPYLACSSNSTQGFCPYVDTACSAMNTCKTCTNPWRGDGNGGCVEIVHFPNATIAEYGTYHHDLHGMMAEIFARGPIKASISADPIRDYHGGIIYDDPAIRNLDHNHGISIVGWGKEVDGIQYWIVRNSWGEYWGEGGMFRVELGKNLLGIEANIAWATPGSFSSTNFPCDEDGANCRADPGMHTYQTYKDPSTNVADIYRRLAKSSSNGRSSSVRRK